MALPFPPQPPASKLIGCSNSCRVPLSPAGFRRRSSPTGRHGGGTCHTGRYRFRLHNLRHYFQAQGRAESKTRTFFPPSGGVNAVAGCWPTSGEYTPTCLFLANSFLPVTEKLADYSKPKTQRAQATSPELCRQGIPLESASKEDLLPASLLPKSQRRKTVGPRKQQANRWRWLFPDPLGGG